MTDYFDQLEDDLLRAACAQRDARRAAHAVRRRRMFGVPPALLAAGVVAVGATGAAAATLTVLRGSPIPAPRAVDAGPAGTPVTGSATVSELRAADPTKNTPAWTIRTARTADGLVCSTVGQVVDGDFGLVGGDGRFRVAAEGAVDGCGLQRKDASAVAGARIFYARQRSEVRTVVNGVAGKSLKQVTVTVRGQTRSVTHDSDGRFVLAIAGYPEDLALSVRLTFDSGHVEQHPFGLDPATVPDPVDGPAWRATASQFGSAPGKAAYPGTCASFQTARARLNAPRAPLVCGLLARSGQSRSGFFYAIRRLSGSECGSSSSFLKGGWCGLAPRTALWGVAGDDVREVIVRGAPGGPRTSTPVTRSGRTLLVVLPPVDPGVLRVEVVMADGRQQMLTGDQNLIAPPKGFG